MYLYKNKVKHCTKQYDILILIQLLTIHTVESFVPHHSPLSVLRPVV